MHANCKLSSDLEVKARKVRAQVQWSYESGVDWSSRTGSTTANIRAAPGGLAGSDFSHTVRGALSEFYLQSFLVQ